MTLSGNQYPLWVRFSIFSAARIFGILMIWGCLLLIVGGFLYGLGLYYGSPVTAVFWREWVKSAWVAPLIILVQIGRARRLYAALATYARLRDLTVDEVYEGLIKYNLVDHDQVNDWTGPDFRKQLLIARSQKIA